MKEKILITGASGFLGSAIAREFAQNNYEVIALVRSKKDAWRLIDLPSVRILEDNNKNWVRRIELESPDVVISADWEGSSANHRNDLSKQMSNIERVISLANSAVETKSRIFLHLGTQAEFGTTSNVISDYQILNPESSYAFAKNFLQNVLTKIFANTKTKLIWARVFSVYGPTDLNTSLITSVIKSSLLNKEIKTTNGKQFWNFLYVSDFASAIRKLVQMEGVLTHINVGHPENVQVKEVLSILEQYLTNFENVKIGQLQEPGEESRSLLLDPQALLSTGWKPKITLEEGLKSTIDWWKTVMKNETKTV